MQLDPALAQFHDQLTAAAGLGDERTKQIAEHLAAAATPAVRLAILGALSAAADEITAALLDHPGSPAVSIRLDGDEVRVVIDDAVPVAVAADTRTDDGDASARISLRLSESLKSDIDAAATRDDVSVNTWLVRAASAALQPNPFAQFGAGFAKLGGLAGRDFGGQQRWGQQHGGQPRGGQQHGGQQHGGQQHGGQQRITGWIDG